MDQIKSSLRHLPSVDAILQMAELSGALESFGRASVTEAIRKVLGDEREAVKSGASLSSNMHLAERVLHLLKASGQSSLRPLFNLTGTVLHTNLGRAILAEAAVEAATQAMRQAVSLEFDLSSGGRGERDDHLRALVCELTGAEDATVVNNNAAAVLLVLNSLAAGREAIVSRGELIEIGGGVCLPGRSRHHEPHPSA